MLGICNCPGGRQTKRKTAGAGKTGFLIRALFWGAGVLGVEKIRVWGLTSARTLAVGRFLQVYPDLDSPTRMPVRGSLERSSSRRRIRIDTADSNILRPYASRSRSVQSPETALQLSGPP